jgi:putative PIN family toxin of toxin-antitoxin system
LTPVVLDTGVVLTALFFRHGPAGRLREAWRSPEVESLTSRATLDELVVALAYPKFALTPDEIETLLADYLPFTRLVEVGGLPDPRLPRCRDVHDQKFLDLAAAGRARWLVTGDRDLLALAGQTPFAVVTVAEFLSSRG